MSPVDCVGLPPIVKSDHWGPLGASSYLEFSLCQVFSNSGHTTTLA